MIEGYIAFAAGADILAVWIIISSLRGYSFAKRLFIGIFIVYMTSLVAVTIFPVIYSKDLIPTAHLKLELIPFGTTVHYIKGAFDGYSPVNYVVMQLLGNILMTIPLGIMLPFLINDKEKKVYMAAALIIPVSIELSQLVMGFVTQTMYRTVDIDDVMLNFLGIIIGYRIYNRVLPQSLKNYFHEGIKI